MINQMRVERWLTEKQTISMAKGDIVDALICNALFRANASEKLGDINEEEIEKKIADVRTKVSLNQLKEDIEELVKEEFYG